MSIAFALSYIKSKKMKRWKSIAFVIVGIILCVVGLLVGSKLLPDMLMAKIKEKTCVDSKESDIYHRWVSYPAFSCP